MRLSTVASAAFAALAIAACCCPPTAEPAPECGWVKFRFHVAGLSESEDFYASTSDSNVIERARQELLVPFSERKLHISGPIDAGGAGLNNDWNWHFVPDRWDLVEASMEICDARPGYVSDNLWSWLSDVGDYCPWSARVERESAN